MPPDLPLPPLWTTPPSRDAWPRRAAELVTAFATTVYGRTPSGGGLARVVPLSHQRGVLDGRADRLRHRATLAGPLGELTVRTLLHRPARTDHQPPAPVVVALNFTGNEDTIDGAQADRWPYARIVAAGFAVLTADYREIEPDDPAPARPGVRALFPAQDTASPAPATPATPPASADAGGPGARGGSPWGAIGAWAWGLSRLLDLAGHLDGLDTRRAVVLGHSRLGKAALWAGAQDTRFALTVSNDSGCGGASLHRHPGGEDIAAITSAFPHWFTPSFARYAGREHHLPVDQHQLLAAIAPRRAYVASAAGDDWADPLGEYLATRAAAPAYHLCGYTPTAFDSTEPPPPGVSVGDGIGYHVRPGAHDLTELDWRLALAFAAGRDAGPGRW